MKVLLTTMQDSAAAEVAREALTDAGIPVELRRLAGDVYFGSGTSYTYEVRVPADRLADARGVLGALEEEMERAAIAAAGVPAGEDDEPIAPVENRPRKLAWAVAFALVSPLPGLGLFYARRFGLGLALLVLTLCLGVIRQAFGLTVPQTYFVFVGLKAADLVLAPIFAARFNRTLPASPTSPRSPKSKEPHAAHP